MFEWGGGCLWCGDDAARQQFDVGPIEARLPLSRPTRRKLEQLSAWHDQSLNREYPPDPGPWSPDESASFDSAAEEILGIIQQELGPDFQIVYEHS